MTAKMKRPRGRPQKKNGKSLSGTRDPGKKVPSKYTIMRSQQDVKDLDQMIRQHNEKHPWASINTHSQAYKKLPSMYADAVKMIHDQDLQIQELTAKLHQLQDLEAAFCRILDHVGAKHQ